MAIINGTSGPDTLPGSADADADESHGLGGNVVINGGAGSDAAVFAGNRALWAIRYPEDGIQVSNGVETNRLTGMGFLAFADSTLPAATPNIINGTEGDDTLSGDENTPSVDIIHGLGGADVIQGYGGDDSLYGDDGDDTVHGGDGDDHIEGGAGGDILWGEDGHDTMIGEDGDDLIHGGGGDDQIDGGDGYNNLYGNAGDDTLLGGADGDQMDGGDDNDVLTAGAGYDTLFGGAGDDQLHGGSGDDSLTGGMGADLLNGGEGEDRVYYNTAVTIDLTGGVANTGEAAGDVFVSIESFHLSEFDDEFTGTSALEFIFGNGGNDVIRNGGGGTHTFGGSGDDHIIGGDFPEEYLYGQEGDHWIEGGAGRDFMFSEAGNDIFDGGDGNDGVAFQNGSQRVTVDLRITTAQLLNDELGWDTLISIEELRGENYQEFHFTGNAVDNAMSGNALDDILIGLEGNDSLSGGSGADHLDGGDDNDFLYCGEGNDLALGGAGVDSLSGERGDDVLDAGQGNDSVDGGTGDDRLIGGGGNDILAGGDGTDTVDYSAAAGGVTANLALEAASNDGDGGSDTIFEAENLTGSAFADTLTGNALANLLIGGAGADSLSGSEGDDVLRGGAGIDVLNGDDGYDTADYSTAAAGVTARLDIMRATNDGDGGTDTFTSIEAITGSNFNDVLIGGGLGDTLRGGLGSDTLLGFGGADILWGGSGAANTLQGGLGDDWYVLEANDSVVELAGQGVDTVEARIAVHTLAANVENLVFGGTGNFTGTGNSGDNTITGGAGDDVLRGRGGTDVLIGGLGMDTADYSQAAAGVHARLDNMRAVNDGDGGTDTFVGIEAITGSAFNDLLVGGALGDRLSGGLGADTLLGFAGNDILSGGQGAANQLQGGLGDDLYILDATDTIVELAGQGHDTIEARVGAYTMAANVEDMYYVGVNKFYGTGNALNNVITGGIGNDVLRGMGGNDTLNGGAGTDEAQFRGSKAQYTVTAEGAGYRVVDSVAGRDGSTFVESIETLRFLTGNTTTALSYPPPAPAALEPAGKAAFEAEVLPALFDGKGDDAFVLPALPDDPPLVLPGLEALKGGDEPLVLPDAGEPPLFVALEARLDLSADGLRLLDGFEQVRDTLDPWG